MIGIINSFLLLFSISHFLNTFASLIPNLCCPDQRDVLLEFKNEFNFLELDHGNLKTKSWVNSSDCCSWDGITCDAKSGNVIGIDLSCSCLNGRLKSNSSLFILQHLRDLNLAYNNFTASPIPVALAKLKGLERLNLSESSFSGEIPTQLLQLTNLVSLDLSSSSSFSPIPLFIKNPLFLHILSKNLRSLSELDMSFVNISLQIPHEFSSMWSLRSLHLKGCNLFGEFPSSVLLIPNLQSIILDRNPNLRGSFPTFGVNNSMRRLSFYKTSFSGEIPSSLGNLKQLTHFNVGVNKLSGNFPTALLSLTQLRYLKLYSNQFTGFLPPNISQLSKLEYFDASANHFTGAVPPSLFKISSLTDIFLYSNNLNDLLGIENISFLPNLNWFYIGDNKFGVSPVDLNLFTHLKQLRALDLSGIPLSTTNITSNFPSHLLYLYLSSCGITEFPEFIKHQRNLKELDLSNNKIKGQVPNWLWRFPELTSLFLSNNFIGEIPRLICGLGSLSILDLSYNNLHGSIPWCLGTHMSSLSDLNLQNNYLSGVLPDTFMNARELRTLDVSHNLLGGKLPVSLTSCSALEVLNMGSNIINDVFPFWLNSLQKLQLLVLRSNKFHGTLHHSDGVWFGFPQLKIVDVSHNNFHGALPSNYFLNWTAISTKRDTNTKADYIGNYHDNDYYTSLVVMSKGVSMEMERIFKAYTIIDFSGNQLHGKIPDSVGVLKELHVLNLSNNAFRGHIPSSLENLTNLESLDLSQNMISGEIPRGLGALSSLEWINISHNQLVGPIPQSAQFQTQNCSCYEGNPGLYGPILKDVCGDIHALTPLQSEWIETKEDEEEWFSWTAARFGLVPGVVFGLTVGYIVALYKHKWFMKTFGRSKHWSTTTR